MNTVLRRVGSLMSPVALLVAILALVVSAAGVGYAAGQIGTKQIKNKAITAKKIKNNAVTTKKIKANAVTADKIADGSLGVAELAPNEVEHAAALPTVASSTASGRAATTIISTLDAVSYRKDRFGTVHLAGVVVGTDGLGGDAELQLRRPGPGLGRHHVHAARRLRPGQDQDLRQPRHGRRHRRRRPGHHPGQSDTAAGRRRVLAGARSCSTASTSTRRTGTSFPKVAAKGQVGGGLLSSCWAERDQLTAEALIDRLGR